MRRKRNAERRNGTRVTRPSKGTEDDGGWRTAFRGPRTRSSEPRMEHGWNTDRSRPRKGAKGSDWGRGWNASLPLSASGFRGLANFTVRSLSVFGFPPSATRVLRRTGPLSVLCRSSGVIFLQAAKSSASFRRRLRVKVPGSSARGCRRDACSRPWRRWRVIRSTARWRV